MKNCRPAEITFSGHFCLGIGLLISCLIALHLYREDGHRIYEAFGREIDAHASSIEKQVHDDVAILLSLKALFDASDEVSRAEFHTFTSFLLSRYPSMQAVGWNPRVPASRRADFETRAKNNGLDQFQITEKTEQGEMVRAGQRDEYYPVYYIEPLAGNQTALAYDVTSNPTRREALYASRDTGQPRATGRITLVQETANEWGLLTFIPIYKGMPTSIAERQAAMQGVVTGVFRIHDLLLNAGAARPADGMIDLTLLDEISDKKTERLYATELAGEKLAVAYRYEKRLRPTSGRQWKLIATPTTAYISKQRSSSPFVSFLIGLIITGWASYYLNRLTRSKKRVEQQVGVRTRELQEQSAVLAQANENLKQEIAERRLLQKRLTDLTDHEQRRLGQELHDSLGQQIAVLTLLAESMHQQLDAAGKPVPKHLDRLTKSAQNAQTQIRALSKGLLPVEIDRWGLTSALEQLTASAKGLSDTDLEFQCDEGIEVVDGIAAMHLYRIAQEALRNALEHGKVSKITITLSSDEEGLKLEIFD